MWFWPGGWMWQQSILVSIKGENITKSKQSPCHLICESNVASRGDLLPPQRLTARWFKEHERVQTKLSHFNPGPPSTSSTVLERYCQPWPKLDPLPPSFVLSDFISGSAGFCLSEWSSGLGKSCRFQPSVPRRVRRGIWANEVSPEWEQRCLFSEIHFHLLRWHVRPL